MKALLLLVLSIAVAGTARSSPSATREIPWHGTDSLVVDVPADVRYIQAPGPGSVTITGPARNIASVHVNNGVLQDRKLRTGTRLTIVVTAPAVTRFTVKGGDTLTIESFDQPELHLTATGRADLKASGRTGVATLDLRGFGWADLSQLRTEGAHVTLTGARHAIVAPENWAHFTGTGAVILLTSPAKLTHDFRGAGRVIHAHRPGAAASVLRDHPAPLASAALDRP